MSAPVSQPIYSGSPGHGFSYKAVTVISVDVEARTAICQDGFSKYDTVRCDIMRAKGNLPAPREQWIIDRQYGQWLFAAIITGATTGVIVPQENVPGLTDFQANTDERLVGINDATLGKIGGKGDILVGGAAKSISIRSPGSQGQYLVTDTSQDSGLAYKDGLALSTPTPGATAPGRYVGNTESGWPVSGVYRRGDWVHDSFGQTWTCAVATNPSGEGGWWTGPGYDGNTPNKHTWIWLLGTVAANTPVIATGYNPWFDSGLVYLANGVFYLRRQGRWAINVSVDSDCSDAGIFHAFLQSNNGPNPFGPDGIQYLRDRRYRPGIGANGFAGSGFMTQNLQWTGWIYPKEAATGFSLNFYWNCPSPTTSCNAAYRVGLEYLGPYG